MKTHGYQIVNEDFEATVAVDRNDIADDELGIYAPLFAEMGRSAGVHPDELCFGLLGAGFTTPCYDAQYFFDTDHPVYPKVDGTGTPALVANLVVDGAYTGEPWYLLDTSRALKPIIFQDRKSPELIAMTKIDDEAVFTRKEFRYGVDCRDAAGFGFWQLAFANKRALTPDNLWDAASSASSRPCWWCQRRLRSWRPRCWSASWKAAPATSSRASWNWWWLTTCKRHRAV